LIYFLPKINEVKIGGATVPLAYLATPLRNMLMESGKWN